jgi:branched-chain amino acid transport system substrate-binding protein
MIAATRKEAPMPHRLISLVLTVVALAGPWADRPARADDGAVVGLVYNETGSQSQLDLPASRGARLALEEANDKGGVLGRPVRWVLTDGRSDPEIIRQRTAELLQSHPSITALMGLSDTDMVLAAARVAAKDGRVFVTSGATSPRLPAEVPGHLFLACFGDNVQAAAAAEWAHSALSARTAIILFNGSMSYTRLLQAYFRMRFEELGGRILASRRYTPDDLEGPTAGLPKADMIFLSAGPDEAVDLSAALRRRGITAPIVGGDGLDLEDGWRGHPELSGIYFTTHAYVGADNSDPAVVSFRKAYLAAYPDSAPDAFAALGYDTARLVLAAVDAAKSADPEAVRAALGGITGFKGVTGTISYAGGSAIPRKSVTIVEVEGGRRRFVRQIMPAIVPPP